MVNCAQPGETIAEETNEVNEEANEEASIETNDDGSFVHLGEELVVTSSEQTPNTTEQTANKTEPTTRKKEPAIDTNQSVVDIERTAHVENTKQSASNTKESCNSTKKSTNNRKQLDNSVKQSAPSSKSSPNDSNRAKQSASSSKSSPNDTNRAKPPLEPIVFRIRTVESDFTGRLKELKELKDYFQQSEPPTPRICVVTGMDGIGKTQLVSKFIVENRSSYQNVIWIDCESSQSMNDSFKTFAKQINATDREGDAKSVVLKRFCGKNTLFVYGNVSTLESIEFALNGTVGGPHVLITSAVENWNSLVSIEVIHLKAWDRKDAVEFVSKKLKMENDSEFTIADIEKLVEKLKCVPLALRLATSYIMWERVISKTGCFKISQYLDAIDRQDPIDDYEKTIFITSTIAYQTIHRTQTRGILAVEILNIIAYLAPNDIERNFFVHLTSLKDGSQIDKNEKMERVAAACRLLVNHGMVTFDKEGTQQHMNIHRSIQVFLKRELLQNADEEKLLNHALKLISDLGTTVETIETVVAVHAVYVFQSAKNYPDLVKKWSMLPAIILLKLLNKCPDPHHISTQRLEECIQKNVYLQSQLHNLAEKDSDTVTILTVLALQYLSTEVDSNFRMSWKFGVPLALTGGVVAIAVGTTVVKQYLEQVTERAVTRVIDRAAQATEAAVVSAINETNQKWIGYVATAATTIAVAGIGVLTGVNLS